MPDTVGTDTVVRRAGGGDASSDVEDVFVGRDVGLDGFDVRGGGVGAFGGLVVFEGRVTELLAVLGGLEVRDVPGGFDVLRALGCTLAGAFVAGRDEAPVEAGTGTVGYTAELGTDDSVVPEATVAVADTELVDDPDVVSS